MESSTQELLWIKGVKKDEGMPVSRHAFFLMNNKWIADIMGERICSGRRRGPW